MSGPPVRRAPVHAITPAVTALLLLGSASAGRAQQASWLRSLPFTGSMTFTQPIAIGAPSNLAGHLLIDPSDRPLAPWVAIGARWNGLSLPEARPTGRLGVRYRRRALRFAVGLSRDVAYGSLEQRRASQGPSEPAGPDTLPRTMDSLLVSLPIASRADTGQTTTGGSVSYTTQPVTDAVASVEWGIPRLAVGIESGWRLAGPRQRRPWISATVATPIVASLALVAGVDQRSDHVLSRGAARMILGLQLRSVPWRRRLALPPAPAPINVGARRTGPTVAIAHRLGAIRLHVRAPRAATVEVRSNLTQWAATPLAHIADDIWQLDLPAAPGVHRLAVRIDGGPWLPPPGLAVGSDGYGASVGLVIVEP